MIGYLRGQVLENPQDGKLLVGVGTGGVVGYLVNIPMGPSTLALTAGKEAELFIHTHVREDAFELFGFVSRIERDLFLTLISVNGIGPRGALGILSNVAVADLVEAILSGDRALLTRIPGVGKKTAERLVIELADSLQKKKDLGLLGDLGGRTASASVRPLAATTEVQRASALLREAQEALVALGYREQEVAGALKRWKNAQGAETSPPLETVLKEVLRELR